MPTLGGSNRYPPLSDGYSNADFIKDSDWHDHETPAMTALNSKAGSLAAASDSDIPQITVGQRMLSATGGSILTALLGEFPCFLDGSPNVY